MAHHHHQPQTPLKPPLHCIGSFETTANRTPTVQYGNETPVALTRGESGDRQSTRTTDLEEDVAFCAVSGESEGCEVGWGGEVVFGNDMNNGMNCGGVVYVVLS